MIKYKSGNCKTIKASYNLITNILSWEINFHKFIFVYRVSKDGAPYTRGFLGLVPEKNYTSRSKSHSPSSCKFALKYFSSICHTWELSLAA